MDDRLEQWIKSKAHEGWTAAEINRMMHKDVQFLDKEDLPSKKTVERVVRSVRIEDSSGPWGLMDSDAEDARLILDVLADVIIQTEGRKTRFTKEEASWVLKLRKVAPDAWAYNVWLLAREYMTLESRGTLDTAALDHYLAFRPWTNSNRFGNYEGVIAMGWIKGDPLRLWDTNDRLWSDKELFPDGKPSLVEGHPFLNGFAYQWHKLQEPDRRRLEKKLSVIKEQNPESYEKILKAGEEAQRLTIEYLKSWAKRSNFEVTAEDKRALAAISEDFYRLLDSAEEGK